ncbi:tripartite tricarboxylate transporter substrate-binding protein [Roseiarcaceae bacterium H3SJ34-1]|uniref:Bug family tripartite tricarboxylate transporter substrate binding protein n=1 Tax=Terripilifer ovatus TaxID=3032367 RepID=UPI003AB94309|nr:tripartite tricarboxylate transporter substrate-binding protein [Roseiarcaceae bacterium H3SJ34-1]
MRTFAILSATAASLLSPLAAQAQAVDYFKGKPLTVITSTGAGGPYDLVARVVSKYLTRNLPGNPSPVIQNMPGAGHVLATNYMYNQAAQDGTVIAIVANSIPLHQMINGKGVRYDARKINWIGSTGISNLATVAWHTSGIKTTDDVMQRELITGVTGAGSGTYLYPAVMNLVLGTKFKFVMGYKSSTEIGLAMERGEVFGRSGTSIAGMNQENPDWLPNKKIFVLSQVGAKRDPLLPDVPLMEELGRNPQEKAILKLVSSPVALGRPFLTGPGVPADRVETLRRAFDVSMKDQQFIDEAAKVQIELAPLTGEQVTKIVADSFATPVELVDKVRGLMAE